MDIIEENTLIELIEVEKITLKNKFLFAIKLGKTNRKTIVEYARKKEYSDGHYTGIFGELIKLKYIEMNKKKYILTIDGENHLKTFLNINPKFLNYTIIENTEETLKANYINGNPYFERNYNSRGNFTKDFKIYYENGKIRFHSIYENGNFKFHSLLNELGFREGENLEYYENGNVKKVEFYEKSNLKYGEFKEFYKTGELKVKGKYKASNKDGKIETFYKNFMIEIY